MARIGLVTDRNWAFERIAEQLGRRLPEHRFERGYMSDRDVLPGLVERCDAILFFWWIAYVTDPSIVTVPAIVAFYDHSSVEDLHGVEIASATCDLVLVANRRLLERAQAVSTRPVLLAEDGVDTTMFRPQPHQVWHRGCGRRLRVLWVGNSRAAPAGMSLTADGPSRDPDHKGFELVRTACARLEHDVELLVVDRARRLVPHRDMPGRYLDADVLVCASRSEGTPNPVLEALASGVPVVSTAVGVVPDVVRDGVNGFVVRERSAEALQDGLRRCLDADLGAMSDAARVAVAPDWDWERKVEPFREAFDRVLEGRPLKPAPKRRAPAPPAERRKRVLLAADTRGWAFDNIACQVARRLAGRFSIEIVYLRDYAPREFPDVVAGAAADLVVFFHYGSWQLYGERLVCPRACLFYDLASIQQVEEQELACMAAVGAANRQYQDFLAFKLHGGDVVLCPDGVDLDLFWPQERVSPPDFPLRVLWTGASDHGVPGADHKGLDGVIRPAVAALGDRVELLVRDRAGGTCHPHDSMRDWYNRGDLVLCASLAEGTPNPILEAAACGRACITTRVGIVPEFVEHGVTGLVVERTPEAFAAAMTWCAGHPEEVARMGDAARKRAEAWSWERQVAAHARLIERGLAAPPPPRPELPDHSDELTVCVVTIGGSTFEQCLSAIRAQDCRFRIELVENVAPMDRAFQAMVDRCTTPFFVQVDEDMILEPAAVRSMLESFRDQPDDVFMVVHPLWDEHVERVIQGCKIYRREAMVAAPYGSDSASCEMDQVRRAAAAGYRYASIPLERDRCVGRHGTHFTPAEAFDRYWRLAQKQKRSGLLAWTNAIPAQFGFRLLAGKGNEADLWGVLGYAAGHIEPLGPERERDFHEQYETFGRLRARMAKPPVGLNVYQTARCNLHCRWCLRTRGQADTGPDVTPRLLEQALDRFPEISVACFAGFGEPLLSETLWECLDVAGKRRLFTQVITNGVLLEERVADLVEHQARNVAVSMNAADPEAYEAATGNPAALFERVVAGVRAAVDAGLRVQISAVLTRSTLHRAPAFAELARTLGVAEVALHNLLPHGVADPEDAGFWGEVLHDGDPEVVEALQRLRVEHGDIVKFWPMPISRTPCPRRCESPFTNVSIDGWGHVGACRRVMPPRQFRIGVSDADIWNSPPFVELREELAGLRELRTECRLCFGNWRG